MWHQISPPPAESLDAGLSLLNILATHHPGLHRKVAEEIIHDEAFAEKARGPGASLGDTERESLIATVGASLEWPSDIALDLPDLSVSDHPLPDDEVMAIFGTVTSIENDARRYLGALGVGAAFDSRVGYASNHGQIPDESLDRVLRSHESVLVRNWELELAIARPETCYFSDSPLLESMSDGVSRHTRNSGVSQRRQPWRDEFLEFRPQLLVLPRVKPDAGHHGSNVATAGVPPVSGRWRVSQYRSCSSSTASLPPSIRSAWRHT